MEKAARKGGREGGGGTDCSNSVEENTGTVVLCMLGKEGGQP